MKEWHVIIVGLVGLLLGILEWKYYFKIKKKEKKNNDEDWRPFVLIETIALMLTGYFVFFGCVWVLFNHDFSSS